MKCSSRERKKSLCSGRGFSALLLKWIPSTSEESESWTTCSGSSHGKTRLVNLSKHGTLHSNGTALSVPVPVRTRPRVTGKTVRRVNQRKFQFKTESGIFCNISTIGHSCVVVFFLSFFLSFFLYGSTKMGTRETLEGIKSDQTVTISMTNSKKRHGINGSSFDFSRIIGN